MVKAFFIAGQISFAPFQVDGQNFLDGRLDYGPTAKANPIISCESYDETAMKALFTSSSISHYSLQALEPAVK